MTKYIVSGYIGFDNFGDEAIARVLTTKLKADGAEKITLISSNPAKTKELHKVDSCGMLDFFNSLKSSDILVSGGGSLLQDTTSFKSLIYYLGVIYLALFMGKKVEIFAQGIGPINSKAGRLLTKIALKNCYKISVRDKKSQDLLTSWGIKSDLVSDPVMNIEIENKPSKSGIGIQLRPFNGVDTDFLNRLGLEICKHFKNKKIKLISLQDKTDISICTQFASILKEKGLADIEILSNLSIDETIDAVSSFEYLIAMRFHANVVGIKSGVKTLAINYDPKVEKLASEYNIPMININDKDFSKAFDVLVR